jgi:hypothetical protein
MMLRQAGTCPHDASSALSRSIRERPPERIAIRGRFSYQLKARRDQANHGQEENHDADTRTDLGAALVAAGHFEESVIELETALRLDPPARSGRVEPAPRPRRAAVSALSQRSVSPREMRLYLASRCSEQRRLKLRWKSF